MKKAVCIVITLALILCTVSGCGFKTEEKLKIGLAAPAVTHGWVAGVAYYAEKYCKENGIDYKLTVAADAEEMKRNIDELLDWGMQALVLWPQWSGMEDYADRVTRKGVPVVSFDVDVAGERVCKVTGNNYDMGYQSAAYIARTVGEGASIAVLEVPSAGSVSELRVQGFCDYFSDAGYDTSGIFKVSEEGFSRDCGYEDMKAILKEHKKVDAVFSLDDETSIGVVKAVTESGRTDVKAITGGGGMQEYLRMIADKQYASLGLMTALYSPMMIEDAIDVAMDLGRGQSAERMVVIPTKVVGAAEAAAYLDSGNTVY